MPERIVPVYVLDHCPSAEVVLGMLCGASANCHWHAV